MRQEKEKITQRKKELGYFKIEKERQKIKEEREKIQQERKKLLDEMAEHKRVVFVYKKVAKGLLVTNDLLANIRDRFGFKSGDEVEFRIEDENGKIEEIDPDNLLYCLRTANVAKVYVKSDS